MSYFKQVAFKFRPWLDLVFLQRILISVRINYSREVDGIGDSFLRRRGSPSANLPTDLA